VFESILDEQRHYGCKIVTRWGGLRKPAPPGWKTKNYDGRLPIIEAQHEGFAEALLTFAARIDWLLSHLSAFIRVDSPFRLTIFPKRSSPARWFLTPAAADSCIHGTAGIPRPRGAKLLRKRLPRWLRAGPECTNTNDLFGRTVIICQYDAAWVCRAGWVGLVKLLRRWEKINLEDW
jgi:hypothetical protein